MCVTKLVLSLATSPYDRTAGLFDGRVAIEGCDIVPVALSPEETFHRAFRHTEFDITEISLSSHTLTVARGTSDYVGVPAFTSRAFRHSGIYIRTDRGISSPADLRGKTIGLPEYQQTANVWIRGLLKDEYGIGAEEIRWRVGGIEQPGRGERAPLTLPPSIDYQPIPVGSTLSRMLRDGELDAVLSPKEPSCFSEGHPHVDRLFPDYQAVEEDYFRKTGIFPIMHLVGIRRSLVEQHPWLPVSILKGFSAAKKLALEELGLIGHLAVTLPWPVAALQHARRLIGEDFWSYGVAPNRAQLDTFLDYSVEQGLSVRRVAIEELFAASTLDMSRL
jgi:4,5-dihydroxyphthalate decarboxylase